MKKALLVIAQNGYQDIELNETKTALLNDGYDVLLASEESGECTGKFGGTESADLAMSDVSVKDFDCIAFIGGPGAAAYASHSQALRIAHEAFKTGMPLGAICIAPMILAKAHVLQGKNATVWASDESIETLEKYGANYTADDVTVDENVVTANGPDAARDFGLTLATLG